MIKESGYEQCYRDPHHDHQLYTVRKDLADAAVLYCM